MCALILGIDPSLTNTGLAILDTDSHSIIYTRTIQTDPSEILQSRLHHIFGFVQQVIRTHHIRHAAIETQFFRKYSSVLKIAMVFGACLVACDALGVQIGQYSPACIKKNMAGHGAADKSLVIHAVETVYGLAEKGVEIDSHIADAIALAHVHEQFLS